MPGWEGTRLSVGLQISPSNGFNRNEPCTCGFKQTNTKISLPKGHVLVSVSLKSRQKLLLKGMVNCLGSVIDMNKPAEASWAFVTVAHKGHCSSTGGPRGIREGRGDGEGRT